MHKRLSQGTAPNYTLKMHVGGSLVGSTGPVVGVLLFTGEAMYISLIDF